MPAILSAPASWRTPVTLKTFLDAGVDIGGLTVSQYLARLAAEATTIINAEDYGHTVYDLSIRRALIQVGEDMVNVAYDAPVDFSPRNQIEDAERRLYELAETGRYDGGFQRFAQALTTAIDMAAHAFQRDGKLSGTATGLHELDRMMGGLQKSDLIILAGRPGMGKTALATNIAYNIAKAWVLANRGQMVKRLQPTAASSAFSRWKCRPSSSPPGSSPSRPAFRQARSGAAVLVRVDFEKIKDYSIELQHIPLYVDETGGLSVAQLAARARRLKRQRGLDLLVIDYLQLLQGSTRRSAENRVQEITEITTKLKALAKELNVPILALSQLSRQVESRDDKRPQLSDLRESGSIEQDADVVLFVFREEYYQVMKKPLEILERFWRVAGQGTRSPRQGGNYHWQTASRTDWHRRIAVRCRGDTILLPRPRGSPAGAQIGHRVAAHRLAARGRLNPVAMSEAETALQPDLPAESAGRFVESGPPVPEAGGILTVNLGAIVANWQDLGRRAMPSECAAVIKAEAYGCGLEPVARALTGAGCKTFFVADLGEARRVRAVAPEAAIYVLNGLLPGTAPAFPKIRVRPVIGSLVELAEWDAFCSANQWHGGAALHVDTGMNRLGISADEAAALAPRIRAENHGIALLMSHLVCAEQPEHPLNERQMKLFRDVRLLYRGIPGSLANSSGIFLGSGAHCDMVRPGAALFGVNPTPGHRNPMRPVIELQARVVQVRTVSKGETIGYNATWTAKHTSRIAVAALGYADGYPRAASATDAAPGADAIVAGTRCPLAGRVSMDLLAIDITALPDHSVRRGDLVALIGGEIGVDELAAAAGTIGYEVLTNLGRRYHRVYRQT